ncbi:MAG: prepilin-type N-terminal cleavage/methylation domain-containing protein [Pirellulaceae bacterium]|jgi:prepilin-type N-terminal cleavage/methylation domain-containing protein
MRPRERALRSAFTLVELLVVIAIIGILVALLLPAVQAAREAASRSTCTNNLKELGIAIHNHHDTLRFIPYSRRLEYDSNGRPGNGYETWAVLIMPFIEQRPAYDSWEKEVLADGTFGKFIAFQDQPDQARLHQIPNMFCPSRRSAQSVVRGSTSGDECNGGTHVPGALGDYAACAGNTEGRSDYRPDSPPGTGSDRESNGAFVQDGSSNLRFNDITDGLSQTLFIGEKHIPFNKFGVAPDSSIYDGCTAASFRQVGTGRPIARTWRSNGSQLFGAMHPEVALFLIGDGSVRGLDVNTNEITLDYLASRRDGQAVIGFD